MTKNPSARRDSAAFFQSWLFEEGRRAKTFVVGAMWLLHAAFSSAAGFLLDPEHVSTFARLRIGLYAAQTLALVVLLSTLAFRIRPPRWEPNYPEATRQAHQFYVRWLWLWGTWIVLYAALLCFQLGVAGPTEARSRAEGMLRRSYQEAEVILERRLDALEWDPLNRPGLTLRDQRPARSADSLRSAQSTYENPGTKDSLGWVLSAVRVGQRQRQHVNLHGMMLEPLADRVDSLVTSLGRMGAKSSEVQKWAPVFFDTLNNLQTLFLFLCFFWLARTSKNLEADLALEPLTVGVVFVLLLTFLEGAVVTQGSHYTDAAIILRWASGLMSGIALAFVAERLASTYNGTPWWLTACLFGYAIIQPVWGAFEENAALMLVMTSIALVLKIILFTFVYWLFETGVLLFHFDRRYELNQMTDGLRLIEGERATFVQRYLDHREKERRVNEGWAPQAGPEINPLSK